MAVPALAAGGKAAALGGLGAATKFGTHKALQALSNVNASIKINAHVLIVELSQDGETNVTSSNISKRCPQ